MKNIGIALLLIGFVWIAWDAADGFVNYQYVSWIWHSQHLPIGENIKRADAIAAMRELCLALKDRHQIVVIPACLMLTGGILLAISKRSSSNEKLPQ